MQFLLARRKLELTQKTSSITMAVSKAVASLKKNKKSFTLVFRYQNLVASYLIVFACYEQISSLVKNSVVKIVAQIIKYRVWSGALLQQTLEVPT